VVETNPRGLPKAFSGGFALTYHLTSGQKDFAVRCFHKYVADIQDRYAEISKFLQKTNSDLFERFVYQERGILVQGNHYPIVRMDWVAGSSLALYVERHLKAPGRLDALAEKFRQGVNELSQMGVAHGDLQHGNILIRNDAIKLIDYDGMFVPLLRGRASNERGHVNYQHPDRGGSHFDANIDNFSAIIIYTSLKALAKDPTLWDRYNSGENLIFSASDFNKPDDSAVLDELTNGRASVDIFGRLRNLFRSEIKSVPKLEQWLAGQNPTSNLTPVEQRKTEHLSPYTIIRAEDRDRLLAEEGNVVTVQGVVTAIRRDVTKKNKPYVFLNFGHWNLGCFTAVVWSDVLDDWKGVPLDSLEGKKVSITGLLQKYSRKGRKTCPQIALEHFSNLQLLIDRPHQVRPSPISPAPSGKRGNTDIVSQLQGKSGSAPPTKSLPPTTGPISPAKSPSAPAPSATANQDILRKLTGGSSPAPAAPKAPAVARPTSPSLTPSPAASSSSQPTTTATRAPSQSPSNAQSDDRTGCCGCLLGMLLLWGMLSGGR